MHFKSALFYGQLCAGRFLLFIAKSEVNQKRRRERNQFEHHVLMAAIKCCSTLQGSTLPLQGRHRVQLEKLADNAQLTAPVQLIWYNYSVDDSWHQWKLEQQGQQQGEMRLVLPPQRIDEVATHRAEAAATFCLISLTFATIAAAF